MSHSLSRSAESMGSTGVVRAAPYPHSPIARHAALNCRAHVPQCGTSGSKRNIAAHESCGGRATVAPGADRHSAVSRRTYCESSGLRGSGARRQLGFGAGGAARWGDNALHTSGNHCMSGPINHDAADSIHRRTQYLTRYLGPHCEQYCDGHLIAWPEHWRAADGVMHGNHTCACIASYASNAIGNRVADAATQRTPQKIVRKIFFAIRRVALLGMVCRPASSIDSSVCAPGRRRIMHSALAYAWTAVYGHTAMRVSGDALATTRYSVVHSATHAAWRSADDEMSWSISSSADGGAARRVCAWVRPRTAKAMWRDTARAVSPRAVSQICSQTASSIYRAVASCGALQVLVAA